MIPPLLPPIILNGAPNGVAAKLTEYTLEALERKLARLDSARKPPESDLPLTEPSHSLPDLKFRKILLAKRKAVEVCALDRIFAG